MSEGPIGVHSAIRQVDGRAPGTIEALTPWALGLAACSLAKARLAMACAPTTPAAVLHAFH